MSNFSRKAFTLVELLVVISIIGVLSSVVFASLSSAKTRAKYAKIQHTMQVISDVAYNCVEGGNSLNIPPTTSIGGIAVCAGDSFILPDITDTGFTYCGNPPACGGWISNVGDVSYAISVHTGVGGSRKVIVCGLNYNASAWYPPEAPVIKTQWNFIGNRSCATLNF